MVNRVTYEFSNVDEEIYSCLNLNKPNSFFLFAGAGSGKTGSLVRVLQRFRDENARQLRLHGQKVAVITYTNAACDEIKRRLEFDSTFIISTIHSFCWRLIQPFQSDIKEWVKHNTEQELEELARAQEKGRAGTKAAFDRERKIASKGRRLESLDRIRAFIYNPNGTNSSHDSLNHAEVIKIASAFLDTKELMQKILVKKYPILLIDESQDTKKELIEALMNLQPQYSSEFSLGLFGDTMQRIYSDGKKNLGVDLPEGWRKPEKSINYRCPKRIIKLINAIRGEQPQTPGKRNEEGMVRLFIVDSKPGIDKEGVENRIVEQMAEFSGDDDWHDIRGVKTLTLEHKMAATRGGFIDFFQPLYDLKSDSTGLIDGTMSGMPFFIQRLLPLVRAILSNDEFIIADLVKKHSPLLDKKKLRQSQSQQDHIRKAKLAVDELRTLFIEEKTPSLLEVVNKTYELGLFEIPDILLPIVQRTDEYSEAPNAGEDDRNLDIDAWDAALAGPFNQLEAYSDYISERSRFGTHQGVKGLEFPRVVVVLDDDEARGWGFSYEKLLGAKELSSNDESKIAQGEDNTVDRTKRLFYVICSRTEKSLAIVAYTQNPEMVKIHAISQGWFDEEELVFIQSA